MILVISCKKEAPSSNRNIFLKTYQTDTLATALQLVQMPDGGFIIISNEAASTYANGRPLLTRTDKYGNLMWNRTIQKYGLTYWADAFLLNDGNFIAHFGSNICKFDTNGNIKNFVPLKNVGDLVVYPISHFGSKFILPACSPKYSLESVNKIYTYDDNLTLLRTDSFFNSSLSGRVLGLFVNSNPSSGTYHILGMKYPNANWTYSDYNKLFAATIPSTGPVIQTVWDSADQNNWDYTVRQSIANDSEAILLGQRITATTSYPIVIKFDKDQKVAWENEFQVNNANIGLTNISLCKDGGFMIVGNIGKTGYTAAQPYALKIDQNGSKQWYKTFPGTGVLYYGINLSDGGYAFVGSSTQFGNSLNTNRILFIKTDANGNF